MTPSAAADGRSPKSRDRIPATAAALGVVSALRAEAVRRWVMISHRSRKP